jgi:hypothetical protein
MYWRALRKVWAHKARTGAKSINKAGVAGKELSFDKEDSVEQGEAENWC